MDTKTDDAITNNQFEAQVRALVQAAAADYSNERMVHLTKALGSGMAQILGCLIENPDHLRDAVQAIATAITCEALETGLRVRAARAEPPTAEQYLQAYRPERMHG